MRTALLILLLCPGMAAAELCEPGTPKGEKCRIAIRDIRPTQFGVGMVDVRAKREEFRQGKKHAKNYLKENRAKIVIGPGGKYYLIDRHHLTRAAYMEGRAETYAEIVDNLAHMDEVKFWKTMEERRWVRLSDETGKARKLAELPRHIKDLKDDPYRSLAWVIRQSDAFRKTEIPFAEFEWADYFRKRIPIEPGKWDEAVKEAIRLATMQGTKHLPGHEPIPGPRRLAVQAKCWENFKNLGYGAP